MPLTLNVGLSRKTSENYNSKGVSINLTAELDQALLTKPDELQDQVSALYQQAEEALERQQNPQSNHHNHQSQQRSNGHGDGMTQSQRRAINAICKRLDTNPADEAKHEFGIELEQMSIREASKLIDHLKSLQPAGNGRNRSGGNGGRR